MTTNAVICELNPMHRGHKYIFDSAKGASCEDSVNIAVMSGNFTQRATPAIFDKYARAEAAVKCGADIVVELPFPWCSSGAESFALGGVAVAAGLGTQRLVFGSETGKLDLIGQAARIKASDEYKNAIVKAEAEARDLGSAVIFDDVMKYFGITESLGANDKLGLEYIRFGRELGILEFCPIARIAEIKSATDLRGKIFSEGVGSCGEFIPDAALEVFRNSAVCREEVYNQLLFNHCRIYANEAENDILAYASKVAKDSATPEEFIRKLPTKKYTTARLRREILFSILGAEQSISRPLYTVLLGMNEKGRAYLSENKKSLRLPIITKPADDSKLSTEAKTQYEITKKADELYALCTGKPASEYIKKHPHII
ncbi:MAG: nucleotidyltransferase family protein [Ruminococcaceae bacterium]|nr:nucleotidyltransferase family protein [Oscillospiraceae bacterium]